MTDEGRQKAAARCTDCGRALAVWLLPSGEMNPIGSAKGCPCGGTSFQRLG
ncbi:hypothetical protein [Natronococcus wangiae]|uniref:hypothetical protein n=1 Tax=Natronococcus wangiae TaxID=3068275 RepID=UPI00273EF76C|nr:hypothetical protein [Natronococcus sp. AD5]